MYNSVDDFVGDFNMNVVGLQILCKISFRCSTSFGFVWSVISIDLASSSSSSSFFLNF